MEDPMKRFAPLALIVLALALVPAALADGTTPAPTPPTATQPTATPPPADQQNAAGHPGVRMRIEILHLRLQIVRLRFRLNCGPNGRASHDKCVAFAQKIVERLTKLDANVQQKIVELHACTPDSTDATCKNADKKIDVLTKLDTRLQNVIQKLQDWLNGKGASTSSDPSTDGALDQAAAGLSQAAAGSNGG
jgi:hypothetical protein